MCRVGQVVVEVEGGGVAVAEREGVIGDKTLGPEL